MSCGVPQALAPELVGWRDENRQLNCYWIKQPETADELDRAIKILHTQELGCHRYSGHDPAILKRCHPEGCDHVHPEMALNQRYTLGPSNIPLKFPFLLQNSEMDFSQDCGAKSRDQNRQNKQRVRFTWLSAR
jgi:hypothetical protein